MHLARRWLERRRESPVGANDNLHRERGAGRDFVFGDGVFGGGAFAGGRGAAPTATPTPPQAVITAPASLLCAPYVLLAKRKVFRAKAAKSVLGCDCLSASNQMRPGASHDLPPRAVAVR